MTSLLVPHTSSATLATLKLQGAINAANAHELQDQIAQALQQQEVTCLVVDMGLVDFLDSAGLNSLVAGLKLAQHLGKQLLLEAVPQPVWMILELTQLDRLFPVPQR